MSTCYDNNIGSIHVFSCKDKKQLCCGCEACQNICPRSAIEMKEDEYGFRYPVVDKDKCIECSRCRKVCPIENVVKPNDNIESYGGYINDESIRKISTSGGAFAAIVDAVLKKHRNAIIFGAVAKGIIVQHELANTMSDCLLFCSSKYTQSSLNDTYQKIKVLLNQNNYIVFSGTPCQIAGLYNYLRINRTDVYNLLSIEVLCAGVATPLLFRKYEEWIKRKYGSEIKNFYWRYKDKNRWDFNCCMYELFNGKKKVIDRWFSGYWSLFTQRLLMRPSCEVCQYKGKNRVSDITLGDLWGVDKQYPELYDGNKGTSWILINTEKGKEAFEEAKPGMTIRTVEFERMKKYQIPSIMGKPFHPSYDQFMEELRTLDYYQLCKKWAKRPNIKLIYQKYIYNNRMRVRLWKIKKLFMSY